MSGFPVYLPHVSPAAYYSTSPEDEQLQECHADCRGLWNQWSSLQIHMPYHTMEVLCNQDPLNLLCPRLGAKDKSVGTGDLNVHKTTTGSRSTPREEKGLRLSVHLVLPGHQTLNVMC